MRGWHTYWRYPGDSGVPPQFNFAGSRNVKHVDVLWPAPRAHGRGRRHLDRIFGRRHLSAARRAAGCGQAGRAAAAAAICDLRKAVRAGRRPQRADAAGRPRLAGRRADRGRRPRAEAAGAGRGRRACRSARCGASAATATRSAPWSTSQGLPASICSWKDRRQQWALPVPTPIAGAPAGLQRFVFELDGAPTGESYQGALLTLTAVRPRPPIEVTTRLD